MGDEQSMNAIPTGVWVRRELVDALREALNEYPDATLYPTPEAFNVALMDTFKRAAQAARAVVDAVETEDKPKVPTTDLPDAVVEAAAEGAWRGGNPDAVVTWAEQLDAARPRYDYEILGNHDADFLQLQADFDAQNDALAAALARNAELQEQRDAEQEMHAQDCAENSRLRAELDRLNTVQRLMNDEWERLTTDRDAARAELDNLRETLAQKIEAHMRSEQIRVPEYETGLRRAANLVRGSDDEAKP